MGLLGDLIEGWKSHHGQGSGLPNESTNQPVGLTDAGFRFMLLGLLGGAILGFLTRPSVFLVGQLPFSIVISRGGNLSGLDQILVPAAQTSFNQMFFLALLGAGLGFAVGRIRGQRAFLSTQAPDRQADEAAAIIVPPEAENLTNPAIMEMVAAGLGDDLILEKMKYSRCSFLTSSSDLAKLKQNGISDRIIGAMLAKQNER